MRILTTRRIELTKEEQKTIHDLFQLFNSDPGLDTIDIWDILSDIATKRTDVAKDYGYEIIYAEER